METRKRKYHVRVMALLAGGLIFGPAFAHEKAAAVSPQGQTIGRYEITETLEKDTCFPERQIKTRSFALEFVRFSPDQIVLLDRHPVIVNPIEHPILAVNGTFQINQKNEIHGQGEIQDRLQMKYGQFGSLSSDLTLQVSFRDHKVEGQFGNAVVFEPGILGYGGLDLWLSSYHALQKTPIKADLLPAISVQRPCEIQGRWHGMRVERAPLARGAREDLPSKVEMNYIGEMRKAEELFGLAKLEENIEVLKKITQIAPHRPEPYWQIARAYFSMNELLDPNDREGRLRLLAQAEAILHEGLKQDNANPETWFWLSAILGRTATTKGILSAIRVTGRLERGLQTALQNKPTYSFVGFSTAGDTNCALGIYYRLVPDWWIVQVLTGSRGNIDRAVHHNREAIRYQPYRVEYHKELGVSLLCRGLKQKRPEDIAEGLDLLKKTLTLPNILRTDPIDKNHVRELLINYDKACAYSRDGYEDISEESYQRISQTPTVHE